MLLRGKTPKVSQEDKWHGYSANAPRRYRFAALRTDYLILSYPREAWDCRRLRLIAVPFMAWSENAWELIDNARHDKQMFDKQFGSCYNPRQVWQVGTELSAPLIRLNTAATW